MKFKKKASRDYTFLLALGGGGGGGGFSAREADFLPRWSDLILLCQEAERQVALVGLIPAVPFTSFKIWGKVLKIS